MLKTPAGSSASSVETPVSVNGEPASVEVSVTTAPLTLTEIFGSLAAVICAANCAAKSPASKSR